MKAKLVSLVLCISIILLTSCANVRQSDGKAKILVTSVPILSIAENIIYNEHADAECILPTGADSHDFDPSIGDINKVTSAAAFVYCGDELEAWALDIAEGAGGNSIKTDASEGIKLLIPGNAEISDLDDDGHGVGHEHNHGADPHIWTSPANMLKMAENVYASLCQIKVATADGDNVCIVSFDSYQTLVKRLGELDERCKELADLQEKTGKILFFGDAFAFLYLMEEYGFEYVSAYPGCSDEVEPSLSRLAEVSEQMELNHAEYIFIAEMSNGEIAKSLAEQADAQTLTLHSCHNVSAEEAQNGDDYFSLMDKNLDAIEKALS